MTTKTNLIQMPHVKSRHRAWARGILDEYYRRKAKASSVPPLTQSLIDGKSEGWERESTSTNAKLHKILHGKEQR